MKIKLLIISILVILGLVAYKQYHDFSAIKSINSYESCTVANGSIIQTSYPAICITRLGGRFIQPIPDPSSPTITKDQIIQNSEKGFFLSQFISSTKKKAYSDAEFNFSFELSDSITIIKSTDDFGQYGTISWVFSDKQLDFNILQNLEYAMNSDSIYFLPHTTKQSLREYSQSQVLSDKIINGKSFMTLYDKDKNHTSYVVETNNGVIVLSFHKYKPEDSFPAIDQILSTFKFTD